MITMFVFSTMMLTNLDPLKASKELIKHGFGVELCYDNFMFFGGKSVEDKMFREVIEGLTTYEKKHIKSVHMPYDEIDVDTTPMDAIVSRMVKWLDFAHEIGAGIAVFHTLKGGSGYDVNVEFFKRIAKEALDRGVRVAVENRLERNVFGAKPSELKSLLEGVGEDMGICLDVGHANINNNLRQFLETLGDRIIELHIHDNDGQRDLHKPPYTGTVDWGYIKEWLKLRREKVLPVFEVSCRENTSVCISMAKSVAELFRDVLA